MLSEKKITKNCYVLKNTEILIIHNDLSNYSKQILYCVLLFISIILSFSFLGIFLNNFLELIIFLLLIVIFFTIPSLIVILYFKNHIIEIKIDKSLDNITYNKNSSIYKKRKEFKISQIEYLIIEEKPGLAQGGIYALKFFLKIDFHLKKCEIFNDTLENCKKLGIIVAEFFNKYLYYKEGNWRDRII